MSRFRNLVGVALLAGTALPAQTRPSIDATEASRHALELPADPPETFRIRWTHAGEHFVVDLWRHRVRAATFAVVADDGTHRTVVPAPPPLTYRGSVAGRPELTVAGSLRDGGLTALVVAADGASWTLQPLDGKVHRFAPSAALPPGACGTRADRPPPAAGGPQLTTGGQRIAELAFDVDHDYFVFRGSSVAAVVAAIEAATNAANAIYERDVDITHRLTQIVIRTSEPDPYDGNDAGALLDAFRIEWVTNQSAVRRDIAHFVTSRPMGNILGLAWVSVVCDPGFGYGLSRFGSDFGQDVSVLAHELGHNWSAPHCLDSGCNLMCGGCHAFGPITAAQIKAYRDTRTCLSSVYPELIAHYRLDDAGSTIADASGNALHGAYRGGPAVQQPGAANGTGPSVRFDGIDDRAAIATAPALDRLTQNFSVAAWIKPDRVSGVQRIFGNINVWAVGLDGDRPLVTFRGAWDRRSTARIPAGLWSHVAFVVDEDQRATFHVDGVNVGTIAAAPVVPLPASEWFVGARNDSSQLFAGSIDDLQIYDGVLSDAQVLGLFQDPGSALCRPELEAYGNGLAGGQGVPTLAISGFPLVGANVVLNVTNSTSHLFTPAALFVGAGPASIPLFGGTLLVDPLGAVVLPFSLLPIQGQIPLRLPRARSASCDEAFLQVVEIDPSAVMGLSFTRGLRVKIGG
jgi:hypothetical protein